MPGRCPWATSPLLIAYPDTEWGVAQHDEARLFEMLTLEGAQAGLNWEIILRKREGYRAAFREFDVDAVARFSARTSRSGMAIPHRRVTITARGSAAPRRAGGRDARALLTEARTSVAR